MRNYLKDNKVVRNVCLGASATVAILSLHGCGCATYNTYNTTNEYREEQREPTKVIIQEKIIIEKAVPASGYTGDRPWSEPTPYPPHPRGQPNHPVPNTNQYREYPYGQHDHPRGQPDHPVPRR